MLSLGININRVHGYPILYDNLEQTVTLSPRPALSTSELFSVMIGWNFPDFCIFSLILCIRTGCLRWDSNLERSGGNTARLSSSSSSANSEQFEWGLRWVQCVITKRALNVHLTKFGPCWHFLRSWQATLLWKEITWLLAPVSSLCKNLET